MYVGSPSANSTETENYILGSFSGIHYIDDNNDNQYEKEFDTQLSDIRLFISYDGAYLLQTYDKTTVEKDEIAIFLEVPKDDIFSDNILLVKSGENAVKYVNSILKSKWLKEKYALSEEEIKGLLESVSSGKTFWDKIVTTVNKVENFAVEEVTELGITVFNKIADFFGDSIRIDEKRWNSAKPDYSLGNIEKDIIKFLEGKNKEIDGFLLNKNYLPEWTKKIIESPKKIISAIIETINENKDNVEGIWALICGLWNGLMDLISGIFALIKLLFQGVKAHHIYKVNEGYYKSLAIEYVDNALQAIINLDWKVVLKKTFTSFIDLQGYIYIELPKQIWNKASALNNTEINYYEGYIFFNIIEFLLPPLKLAKLAKAGKLEKVVAAFDEITSNITKIGKQTLKEANEVAEIFFRVVDNFIAILKKGTEDVSKFINDIYQGIKKWLQETFGIGKKISKSNYDEFSKLYGKLVVKRTPVIRNKFDLGIKKILKELEYPSYLKQAKTDFSKYLKNKKIKSKIDEAAYLIKHKQLTKNAKAGELAEELVSKYLNGKIKPKKSIKIPPNKRRFPDNFHKGTMREVKSGQISMKYKEQIDKDIQILFRNLEFNSQRINKIEWHAIDGIDEVVLKYIQTEMRAKSLPIEKFQVILY
ncbi:MAG TPA: hypothetical protein PLX60_10145 [Chitinophagales bacterium]|nr:hypothetical protein [Chitinophagales bacterium]